MGESDTETDVDFENSLRDAERLFFLASAEWTELIVREAEAIPIPPKVSAKALIAKAWNAGLSGRSINRSQPREVSTSAVLSLVRLCDEFGRSTLQAHAEHLRRRGVAPSQARRELEGHLATTLREIRERKWAPHLKRLDGLFDASLWIADAWGYVEERISEFVRDDLNQWVWFHQEELTSSSASTKDRRPKSARPLGSKDSIVPNGKSALDLPAEHLAMMRARLAKARASLDIWYSKALGTGRWRQSFVSRGHSDELLVEYVHRLFEAYVDAVLQTASEHCLPLASVRKLLRGAERRVAQKAFDMYHPERGTIGGHLSRAGFIRRSEDSLHLSTRWVTYQKRLEKFAESFTAESNRRLDSAPSDTEGERKGASGHEQPPLAKLDPASEMRHRIASFMDMMANAGHPIQKKEIWLRAGYTDATMFERVQSGRDPSRAAIEKISKVISMTPEVFLRGGK